MAGSFTSPSGAPAKMHVGKVNRPKRSGESVMSTKPGHPITDGFASKTCPSYEERRRLTNNKSGFNTKPARPPAGRHAQRPPAPSRGHGKVI